MSSGARLLFAIGLAVACGEKDPEPAPDAPAHNEAAHVQAEAPVEVLEAEAPADLAAHGKELVGKYECNRCHDIEGVAEPTLEFDCAGCHQQIRDGTFTADRENLPHYQKRVKSLVDVPELQATSRFRRAWVGAFLADTHDLRPNLVATMPRFQMPPQDAEAIAAFLVPTAERERPDLGDPEAGRAVLEAKGCMSCHRSTFVEAVAAMPIPVELPADVFARAQQLAPDLRFARDRMRAADLVAWIEDPTQLKAVTLMPKLSLTRQEALDAAAFIMSAPLRPEEPTPVPAALPVTDEQVTWAHVYERVFGKVCRHCHSDPNEVIGDGGPGYIGGFGFRQRKLDLSTYQGAQSGSLDDDGKRRSIFKKDDHGMPRIVAHLWARHAEVAGTPVEGVTGMPLGLPPLPPEDIQLIETWIAHGRPQK
jgi:cytochrome c1